MLQELDGDQIRIQTNCAQTFEAWSEADAAFRHSYKGRLNWSSVKGQQYLYRINGKVRKSLGPRSPETEKLQAEYTAQRKRLRERRNRLAAKLKEQARLARAYRLGRVPRIAADILRTLGQDGLLGGPLIVVGTHSLYAYEAGAGVHVADDLIATADIDLLWDARQKLKLAVVEEGSVHGVLGVLRSVDKTFARTSQRYRAANDDGFLVDLIRPFEPDEMSSKLQGPGGADDLEASAILGLQWLINAPKYEHIVIAEDGMPVRLVCVDPRAFALHKYWLSKEAPNREPAKRRRDLAQAKAAAVIARDHLDLPFKAKDLSALPLRMVQQAKELARA